MALIRGAVYLFNVDNSRKTRIIYVDKINKNQLHSNPESRLHNNDHFGSSVSLVGNNADGYKLAVGAYGINKERGAVYLFDLPEFRNGQIRYIDKIGKNQLRSNPESRLYAHDHFGSSVSLVGNDEGGYKLAVGAGINKERGAVYLFDLPEFRNGQIRYIDKIDKSQLNLTPESMLYARDHFGSSDDLVGNDEDGYKLAVGAYGINKEEVQYTRLIYLNLETIK